MDLPTYELIGQIGTGIVVFGVAMEGAEIFIKIIEKRDARRWIKKESSKRFLFLFIWIVRKTRPVLLWVEGIALGIVVAGLAIEWLGTQGAERIQSADNAKLLYRAGLLESNNLVLQKELQPRIVTKKQITDFIRVSAKIPKNMPIVVHASFEGDDTLSYAIQLRYMLDEAKFPSDEKQFGVKYDLFNPPQVVGLFFRSVGNTNTWPSVIFAQYGTNNTFVVHNDIFSSTNDVVPISVTETNPQVIYEGIEAAFRRIGIKTQWQSAYWLKPGECEIYIPPKNN